MRAKHVFMALSLFMSMLLLLSLPLLFMGGNEGLCESATDESILGELVRLQAMGCPADIIMMALSYLKFDEPEIEHSPVELGLQYLQLLVAVEVLECSCDASEPQEPDENGNIITPSCTCDYEFARIEEYTDSQHMLDYLQILEPTADPLSAANLQQRGELAAQAHCEQSPADDRATAVFQPITYTDADLLQSLKDCGIENGKDAAGMVELHREGTFIEFLATEAARLGLSSGSYVGRYPVPAVGSINCPFGWRIHPITNKPDFHKAVDIGTQWHVDIKSIADGVVVGRGTDKYDGRYILIRHDTGAPFYSYYAHLSEWSAEVGNSVTAGEVIGIEGGEPGVDPEPGYSTGHHLHFEIRMTQDGGQVNPLSYLKSPGEDEE